MELLDKCVWRVNNITKSSNSHYRKTYIQVYDIDLKVDSNDELLVLNLK